MRRSIALVSLLVVSALVGWVGPANAAAPVRETFVVDAVIPLPTICAFPLTAHVAGKNHFMTFVDNAGNSTRGLLGGQLFVTYTRDDTGASMTFAIPGPTFFDAEGNAILGTGRWTTPMADTGWVLASGHLTFEGTRDGFSLIVSMNGSAKDLCALLSS
jgi:hypothetical protein